MSRLLIRHGLSEANNFENYGTPAFGNPHALLMPEGEEQAQRAGSLLTARYLVEPSCEPVATSAMWRTQQTALVAGFHMLHIYPELNEEKGGMTDHETRRALENRQPPEATILAARHLIEHPPIQRIWFTHALLIATICQELGVYQDQRFTPQFAEVREVPID